MRRTVAAITTALTLALVSATVSVTAWAQGSWTVGPELPTPRSEIGAALVNDQIFVLGGGLGPSQRLNEVLSVSDGTWRTAAPMPVGLNHHGVVAFNGLLYVFGGADEGGRPTTTSMAYDPAADAWKNLAPLPTPRASP